MIVGISGHRGNGKTALANILVKNYGFIKLSFAEELKELAKTIFPLTEIDMSAITRKEKKFKTYDWTPREFLCNLGDFVRYHDRDYWLNKCLSKCSNDKVDYVIDDVRFENEAVAIKAKGGKVIRVNRYPKQNPYGKPLDIPSETSLDDYQGFDFTVHEVWNTSLEALARQADIAMETLKGA
jgi:hypothetical protein